MLSRPLVEPSKFLVIAFDTGDAQPGGLADILESAVSLVAEQFVLQSLEALGSADFAPLAVRRAIGGMVALERPVGVLSDVEIRIATNLVMGIGAICV